MNEHVVGLRTYFATFAALLVLLVLTVAAGELEAGPLALTIALSIAVAKALLIAIVFMHIRWSPPVVRLTAAAGFLWLAILMSLTVGDLLTRGWPEKTGIERQKM